MRAIAVVKLQVQVDGTGKVECLRFHVLESSKPIWQGELYNCGLILGTNTLIGFVVSHSNGAVMEPTGEMKTKSVARVFQIVLTKDLHVRLYEELSGTQ